jgi:S-adenosylmethionine/arginine decarboxylase-like enzyme
MIETSHIAFHIWDEPSPALLQFDLYTCGALNQKAVLDTIKTKFAVAEFDYILLDRENGFVTEEHGFE